MGAARRREEAEVEAEALGVAHGAASPTPGQAHARAPSARTDNNMYHTRTPSLLFST